MVGVNMPLSQNNTPKDAFESGALSGALTGQNATAVQRVKGKWYYRRSVALSNFHPSCVMCHTNFPAGPTSDWMGALMLRVPIPD